MARTKKQDVDQSQEKRESEKPKRVLTEAQRLAFLKGREKRMANIEMKKSIQQQDSHTVQPSVPVTKSEDTVEDKTTQESVESMEEVADNDTKVSTSGFDEDDDIPTLQPNKRPKEKSITKANPKTQPKSNSVEELYEEDDDEHDITARKIADYVFDRLKMLKDDVKREEQNLMDVRTVPSRPARVRSKSMTTKKQSSLSTSEQPRKTRSAPPAVVEPAPQRTVNWM